MKKTFDPFEVVHGLSLAIAKAKNVGEVCELILDEVVQMFQVERASIMVYDERLQGLRVAAQHGMDPNIAQRALVRIGEGISGKVFERHEPLLIADITAEERGPHRGEYRTTSLMSAPVTCFPLKVGEVALGVINVTDRIDGKPFAPEDLKLLTTISNQAASYLHICRLSEQVQSGERLRQELEIARQMQYRLLPRASVSVEGLDVTGRLLTAERVGGDYFDCFVQHPTRPAFVIADVSGHSIGAAMTMAAFRSAVRAEQDSDYSPATLSQRVNQILYEDLYQAEQFISMGYVQYLRSRQLIQFTTSGHPPLLLWRATDKKCETLSTSDPLLGIDTRAVFREKKMVVAKGDVLVLYTDGVTEAANEHGERFGIERLMSAVADAAHASSQQIADVVVEGVSAFVDPKPLRDDVTVLVLKVV